MAFTWGLWDVTEACLEKRFVTASLAIIAKTKGNQGLLKINSAEYMPLSKKYNIFVRIFGLDYLCLIAIGKRISERYTRD